MRQRSRIIRWAAGSAAAAALLAAAGAGERSRGTAPGQPGQRAAISVFPMLRVPTMRMTAAPSGGYNPAQIRAAYSVSPLLRSGIDGKGQSIVIVDSFGSPTIRHDLGVFDRQFKLPAPPSLLIIHPAGRYRDSRRPARGSAGPKRQRLTSSGRTSWPRGADRAGRDAGVGERGPQRLPADRHGGEVRHRAPPRRRDQPELRRHRGDLPQGHPAAAAGRLPGGGAARPRCHDAERLGRRGRHRLPQRPDHLLHPPRHVLAGQRPAGHGGRGHRPAARQPGQQDRARPGVERPGRQPVRERRRQVDRSSAGPPTRTPTPDCSDRTAACPTSR